jgi:cyclophilin family peptidyl-prolyl cis-trans isomerase
MSKLFSTVMIFQLFLFSAGCDSKEKATPINTATKNQLESLNKARIKTSKGDIVFEFYPKHAPATVTRIKELINQKFYNGLVFHRVVPGFVVQGGDPTGTGRSGSGKNIKAEFNSLKHVEGTLAMARSQDVNSADSQFYISLGTHPHLDNNYTIFGQVKEGMEVAKSINQGDKMILVTLE